MWASRAVGSLPINPLCRLMELEDITASLCWRYSSHGEPRIGRPSLTSQHGRILGVPFLDVLESGVGPREGRVDLGVVNDVGAGSSAFRTIVGAGGVLGEW